MSSKIYVGNLPYSVTDATLESNFAEFGGVSSAKVMMDRETGRSKGFGFVEMANAEVAQAAISALHGMSVDGRSIVVNLARPRETTGAAGGYSASGYNTNKRSDVGHGNGGSGGGRYQALATDHEKPTLRRRFFLARPNQAVHVMQRASGSQRRPAVCAGGTTGACAISGCKTRRCAPL